MDLKRAIREIEAEDNRRTSQPTRPDGTHGGGPVTTGAIDRRWRRPPRQAGPRNMNLARYIPISRPPSAERHCPKGSQTGSFAYVSEPHMQ